MKKTRYCFLTVVLAVCLCMTAQAGELSWKPEGQPYTILLSENEDGETLTILGFDDDVEWDETEPNGLVLPTEVNGKTVTVIAEEAFQYRVKENLSPVILPERLVTIGNGAFDSCYNMCGPLVIPDTVETIGDYAFMRCKVESLDLGEGVKTIGVQAFRQVPAQQILEIPDSVQVIGDSAFYGAAFTGLELGSGIKSIGAEAFKSCENMKGSIVIPEGCVSIGDGAFYYYESGGGTLTLPDSLEILGEYAFWNAEFTGDLTMNGIREIGYRAFDGANLNGSLHLGDQLTVMGEEAFAGCTGLTGDLMIPGSLKTVPKWAFRGCTGLTGNIVFGEGVKVIEEEAFLNCSGFTGTIALPQTLTTIGDKAFYGCKGFTGGLSFGPDLAYIGYNAFGNSRFSGALSFPEKVADGCIIRESAFEGCTGLVLPEGQTDLVIPEGVSTIEKRGFNYLPGITGGLVLPESLTELGQNAFSSGGFTGTLQLPSKLKTIPEWAFSACKFSGQLILPADLTSIGANAFINSNFSGDLVIPDSVEQIGERAFYKAYKGKGDRGTLHLGSGLPSISKETFLGCVGFTGGLYIPGNVAVIGEDAFYECTGFNGTLTLSYGVEQIGSGVFYGCSGFTGGLTLPESLTSLGSEVFSKCKGLNGALVIDAPLPEIPPYTFYECSGLIGTITLPETITAIGYSAFYRCKGLTGRLEIPYDVVSIGDSAFYYCSGFTELQLSGSLEELGGAAFYQCTGLTGKLDIPDGVTSIGSEAFYFCRNLTELELPSKLEVIGYKSFRSCRSLKGKAILPQTVTHIYNEAFYDCGELEISPVMPRSLTYIGDSAFSGMANMKGQLYLPDGLTWIGEYAFAKTGLTGDVIVPPGVTKVGGWAFSNCVGVDGTVRLPYGITGSAQCLFQGCDKISAAWIPTDLPDNALLYGLYSAATIYYGGTEEQWAARSDERYGETIYYECYPAKGLEINGGSSRKFPVGRTFTLDATWYSSEASTDPTFSWSTTAPEVFRLENTTTNVSSTGYSARLTATFTAMQEGAGTISVSGPDSLSDSVQVTTTDLKTLTFLPAAGQSAEEVNIVTAGNRVPFTFRYVTSGVTFDEWEQIQWSIEAAEEGLEEVPCQVQIDSVTAANDQSTSIDVTLNVIGVTPGAPVKITLTGPGDCMASVQVAVPADKIIILDQNGNVPEEGEVQRYRTEMGDPFVLKIRYESADEEAVVKNTLENLTFTLTTEDFFIHPDDLQENVLVELRGSKEAIPLKSMTFKKIAEGAYTAEYTFATAMEGVTVLRAANDKYAEDLCIVYSTFDVAAYRAYLYHTNNEEEGAAADNIHQMLAGDTPATIILEELQKRGFAVGAVLWDSVKAGFETSQDPSNLYDLVIREQDMYYALLLEVLEAAMEDTVKINARTFTKFADGLVDDISDVFKALYEADLPEMDELLTDEEKKVLLEEMTIQSFGEKYKGLETASEIIEMFDIMAIGVDTVQDFEKRLSSAAVLAGMSESMEIVLRQMLAECTYYSNTEALEAAIEDCLSMVGKTREELLLDVTGGTLLATGRTAAFKLFGKFWEGMMDRIKITHPAVAAIYAAYYGGSTVSNALFSTDATLEEYYKMVALQDIKTIARAAHDTLSVTYVAAQDTASAEAYLNAIDLLLRIHLQDCDQAYDYVDVLDKSVWNAVEEVFGDDTTDDAMTIIKNFRNNIETQREVSQVMWIDYVGYTYPGTQMHNLYQSAYEAALGISRRVVVACPVEVYVEDGLGNVVAYVTETTVGTSVDDISVMLDGEEKTITFEEDASYTLRIAGTATGTMDITDTRYGDNGEVVRMLEYNDLPVSADGEYMLPRFDLLKDEENQQVKPDSDSREAAEYTLTMYSCRAEGLSDGKARAGQNIAISAVVPDGYVFAGWVCDNEEAAIEDVNSAVTSLRMPAGDVTLTAQLKIPDGCVSSDRLILTDRDGYILREIPEAVFTVRVTSDLPGILAAYDANGRMLSVQMLESFGGLIAAELDNTAGEIHRIALFRIESLENPVPMGKPLEVTAK